MGQPPFPIWTSYQPFAAWSAGPAAPSLMNEISVYIHFPWCLQKCPYCDFASSGIERPAVPHEAYADAVLHELQARLAQMNAPRLRSVFFGGGTPSLWSAQALGRVLAAIKRAFPLNAEQAEVTVECNPTSLPRAHAAALRDVGVNRLSLGVQSLDRGHLRFLGRLHDDRLALRAVEEAALEVPRVSADLMFGMPGQSPEAFCTELRTFTELGLRHLSVYALTVEPDTQFGALHRKGRLQLAKENVFAETYLAAEETLRAAGLAHYEVSNYAAAGQESIHNLHYWRAGSYLGLGAGAVGCLRSEDGGRRYRNDPNPGRYMEHAKLQDREVSSEQLNGEDTLHEGLMLGLRTAEGVDVEVLGALSGRPLLRGRERAIARHQELGNLTLADGRLKVPHTRWLHLDGIVADLF